MNVPNLSTTYRHLSKLHNEKKSVTQEPENLGIYNELYHDILLV